MPFRMLPLSASPLYAAAAAYFILLIFYFAAAAFRLPSAAFADCFVFLSARPSAADFLLPSLLMPITAIRRRRLSMALIADE